MTVKQPYAVISKSFSRYSSAKAQSPRTWSVFEIGRETPLRIYRLAEKPINRWGTPDTYYPKDQAVITRFDTEDEAVAFIDGVKAYVGGELAEQDAAHQDEQAARERVRTARQALDAKLKTFWERKP